MDLCSGSSPLSRCATPQMKAWPPPRQAPGPHSAPKQGEATEFRKVFWLSWPCQVYDLNEYSTVSGFAVALLTAWRTVAAVVDEPPLNQTNPSAQGNPPQASLGLQDATHTF